MLSDGDIDIIEENVRLWEEMLKAKRSWEEDSSNKGLFDKYLNAADRWKKHLNDNADSILAKKQ